MSTNSKVNIRWMTPARFEGVVEEVSQSRVRSKKRPLEEGSEVSVTYKSGVYKARVLSLAGKSAFPVFMLDKHVFLRC